MTDQELLEAEPTASQPTQVGRRGSPRTNLCAKWRPGSRCSPEGLCRALPLAAEKSDEDVEYIHQVRVSVRRAVEALRIFSGLIAAEEVDPLRNRLRQIRLAADEARNWDVMAGRLSHGGDVPAAILNQIKSRRREAQRPIVAVYQELIAAGCEAKFASLIRKVESHRHGEGKRRFRRQAPKYLVPVVKKFFKAAQSDITADASLHALRIRAKKLRYTMEIVAVAFDSDFRKRLYPQVTLFQDLLGTVNDHATAKALFKDWSSKAEDEEEKAF